MHSKSRYTEIGAISERGWREEENFTKKYNLILYNTYMEWGVRCICAKQSNMLYNGLLEESESISSAMERFSL